MEATLRAGELTRQLADGKQVFWLDVNSVFLRSDGTINTDLMPDLIHPNAAGAEAWVKAVEPTLVKLMGGKQAKTGN
jgi:lysophospholipase L1-like esterase